MFKKLNPLGSTQTGLELVYRDGQWFGSERLSASPQEHSCSVSYTLEAIFGPQCG
jgi:hypothetical protein